MLQRLKAQLAEAELPVPMHVDDDAIPNDDDDDASTDGIADGNGHASRHKQRQGPQPQLVEPSLTHPLPRAPQQGRNLEGF